MTFVYPAGVSTRFPGYVGKGQLKSIRGICRRNIVHALGFHNPLPLKFDHYVKTLLPSERRLRALDTIKRSYLTFTVYAIKQITAAGNINADTAWSLFHGEWQKINEVEEGNFRGMRNAFYRKLRCKLEKEEEYPDLLQFEFWARAGKAGLAQYEGYAAWADRLVFEEELFDGVRTIKSDWPDMPEVVKEEYRRTLSIEMGWIEGQTGMRNPNREINSFVFSENYGGYYYSSGKHCLVGSAILFPQKPRTRIEKGTGSIDSVIKAEMGHWLSNGLCELIGVFPKRLYADIWRELWIAELWDRMHFTAFTPRAGIKGNRSPEAAVFHWGGQHPYAFKRRVYGRYPLYPKEFPTAKRLGEKYRGESHVTAERIERKVRARLIRAVEEQEDNRIKEEEIFSWYRKMGIYIALLDWEGKDQEEIENKIEELNLEEISNVLLLYSSNDPEVRAAAVTALGKIEDRGRFLYELFDKESSVLVKLAILKAGIHQLDALKDKDARIRTEAATILGEQRDSVNKLVGSWYVSLLEAALEVETDASARKAIRAAISNLA